MADELVEAICDLDEEGSLALVRSRIDGGTDPMEIIDLCRQAMELIGVGFEEGDRFLPDLIMSGEIQRQVVEMVKPAMGTAAAREPLGKVVVGTVAGDIHDLGKDIVVFMLELGGFEVHDLGVDVPAERFVEKVRETGATVVGMSGLLTLAFDSMKSTVEALAAGGLRESVKVMIGGGPTDEQVRGYVGADAYGKDAMAAVSLAKEWAASS